MTSVQEDRRLDIENSGELQKDKMQNAGGDKWADNGKSADGISAMELAAQGEIDTSAMTDNDGKQTLWPKGSHEYLQLCLDFGAAGMFPLGAMSCPSIPSATLFIYVFAVFTIVAGIFNFLFSTKRKTAKTDHPKAFVLSQLLGLGHVALGTWCMVLAYPNLDLLPNASPQTCEKGPLVCLIIIAAIFSAVFTGLIVYGLYYIVCRRNQSKD